jgi:hypothetical protein
MAMVSKVVVQKIVYFKKMEIAIPFPEPQDKITHQKPRLRQINLLRSQVKATYLTAWHDQATTANQRCKSNG